jgi:hypothetical protein
MSSALVVRLASQSLYQGFRDAGANLKVDRVGAEMKCCGRLRKMAKIAGLETGC